MVLDLECACYFQSLLSYTLTVTIRGDRLILILN